jgi:hypothetical protein
MFKVFGRVSRREVEAAFGTNLLVIKVVREGDFSSAAIIQHLAIKFPSQIPAIQSLAITFVKNLSPVDSLMNDISISFIFFLSFSFCLVLVKQKYRVY